jgi:hypothetical protein
LRKDGTDASTLLRYATARQAERGDYSASG